MAQLVTIQQAAREALKAWLDGELASVTGGVTVEAQWFEADVALPAKAISVIDAGPRRIEWLEPDVYAQAENASDPSKLDVTWSLGAVQQPVQLDVWARSEIELVDILARLDGALNAGERAVGATNVDPFRPGVLLALGGDWAPGRVDFLFESPDVQETASSVGQGEWRATYRGRFDGILVQTATSPKLARVLLQQRLRDTEPADPDASPETTTITLPAT